MDADGSNVVQLTDFPATHRSPAFSPDGVQIAFWSTRDGGLHIYVMQADGSGVRRLTQDGSNMDPSWSPDGKRIVFISNRDGRWRVYTMNREGGEGTDLDAVASSWQSRPVYSPDGQKILFGSTRDDPLGDIFVMNSDGTDVQNLTPDAMAGNYPVWSQDGQSIAFDGSLDPRSGEPWRVYRMHLENKELTSLTDFRAEPHAWAWFPAQNSTLATARLARPVTRRN